VDPQECADIGLDMPHLLESPHNLYSYCSSTWDDSFDSLGDAASYDDGAIALQYLDVTRALLHEIIF
jgi:hypothetical protein